MPLYSTENLGPTELRAISTLLKSHPQEHKNNLRAMLVFGPILSAEHTRDLQILEVIEGWKGPRRVALSSSPDLPLRGRLTFYFLTPEEFERPDSELLPDIGISARQLMYDVEKAYAIVYETPEDYAFLAMRDFDSLSSTTQFVSFLEAHPV